MPGALAHVRGRSRKEDACGASRATSRESKAKLGICRQVEKAVPYYAGEDYFNPIIADADTGSAAAASKESKGYVVSFLFKHGKMSTCTIADMVQKWNILSVYPLIVAPVWGSVF
eukprot:2999084-Amphidinium_carterae.1